MSSVEVDGRKMSTPKTTNRVDQIVIDPMMSARWDQGRCGLVWMGGGWLPCTP